jgi:NitT/TauT family transport system substrate-binding protein
MSGQIDVGWGSPPFGIKEIDEGKIRVIASGAEVPSLRSQTVRVEVVNADTLHNRHDAVMRFVQAFRETLDWMYSDPAAMKMYADSLHMEVGPVKAAIEKFQPKSAKQFDQVLDMDGIVADGIKNKFLDAPLTKEQIAEFIQIPPRQ